MGFLSFLAFNLLYRSRQFFGSVVFQTVLADVAVMNVVFPIVATTFAKSPVTLLANRTILVPDQSPVTPVSRLIVCVAFDQGCILEIDIGIVTVLFVAHVFLCLVSPTTD